MADNTTLPGTGDVIASDDIAGVKYQIVKQAFGVLDSATLVSAANPMPIVIPDVTSSGTLAAAAQTVVLVLNGDSAAAVQITGTWAGTVTFEGTVDNTNWVSINGVSASTSAPQATTTVNGVYRLTPGGLAAMRANMTAFTSGTAVVSIRASEGTGGVFANQILPTKNTDGVSSQAIKPASTAALATDQAAVVALHPSSPLPAGAAILGKVGIDQTTPGTTNAVQFTNTSLAVTNLGTFAVQATLAAETTKVIGTVNIAATQTLATVTTVGAVTAITNALPTGTNSIGNIGTVSTVTSVAASTPAVTTTTAATLSSAATTNATSVKAAAGNLYSVTASNVGAAAVFLKLFNLATAPTPGTSVPFLTIPIAPSGIANVQFGAQGIRMSIGIGFTITNLVTDADTTAIAAAQVKVAIAYI